MAPLTRCACAAQARDIEGFLSTRQQLLTAKPNMKQHWIGLAVAHHLAGNHDMALIVLEQYRNVTSDQRDADEDEVYESSEVRSAPRPRRPCPPNPAPCTPAWTLSSPRQAPGRLPQMIMYRARIFEDAGRLDEALALLSDASEGVQVVDRVGLLEARASLLLRMGDRDAAEKAHRVLIELNPDNYKYHEGLRAALGLDGGGASTSDLTALYDDLSARFPRSNACKRIPLDFLSGDAFEAAVRKYAAPYLDKGIPSLYAALRPLFADPAKRAVLSALAEEWARDAASAPPDRRSWALCFLAQARREAGDVDGALEAAEQAVEAAQGADPDVLVVKADILEAAGDCHRAADIADVSLASHAEGMDMLDTAFPFWLSRSCVLLLLLRLSFCAPQSWSGAFPPWLTVPVPWGHMEPSWVGRPRKPLCSRDLSLSLSRAAHRAWDD